MVVGHTKLGAIAITRKRGDEPFVVNGEAIGKRLADFWQWSTSDLLSNALRGVLAEYIVASALEADQGSRTEWDAFDVVTSSGIRIEVKSGAYLQSWSQHELSKIQFSIRQTYGWDAASNTMSDVLKRQADVYVFCVLAHRDKSSVNPLNLDQWDFYCLSTATLNQQLGHQKSIGLSRLLRLDPIKSSYGDLSRAIDQVMCERRESSESIAPSFNED
ncbi:hypothetical protein PN441_17120 [Spirulina major CS-329]|uniref:hypothetical protein n=1 Tax=Spirulina TaxID=1154 RepID=UPI00232B37D8|nr:MULTISPECIES: hypothetical protein [Spirulina]MDB9494141.1 hypothetical protein [Spirulina subsalsa CS-330]MDB9504802.1 hypothetical protein [Spirulina major CS-329]